MLGLMDASPSAQVLPILTVTVNPALDISTTTEQVKSGHKLRCGPSRLDPGGGGINVARVVQRLGGRPLGRLHRRRAHRRGVPTADRGRAPTHPRGADPGQHPQDFTVDEASTGKQFRFVLQGPELSESEWRLCLTLVADSIQPGGYVVASGSLPPGVTG